MNLHNRITTRRAIEELIIQKAWNDPEFAEALKNNPTEAISSAIDEFKPERADEAKEQLDLSEIKVIFETEDEINFVVPQNPQNRAISDDALSKVAGGPYVYYEGEDADGADGDDGW